MLRAPGLAKAPQDRKASAPVSTLRVAIVGAGPAGIYAADILSKTDLDVSIDLFERLPAPFGLVRYGVAPDHPRIKQIIVALQNVLEPRRHPPAGQRRLRHGPQAGRPAPVLRRRHLLHGLDPRRRAAGPGHRARGLVRRRGLRVLVRRPPGRPAHLAAGGPARRRPRRRQRRARRGPHPGQARGRPAAHGAAGQRLRDPQGLAGHRRARVRAPRPRPGQVLPAGAARARPRAGRRRHRLPRGLRLRRGVDGRHPLLEPDQAGRQDADRLDAEGAGGEHGEPAHPPALPAQAGRDPGRGRSRGRACAPSAPR